MKKNILLFLFPFGIISFSFAQKPTSKKQAVDYVNANGPYNANTNGYCTYYNTTQSQTFQKNDCGSGGTGSSVTYTVAANTYSFGSFD